MRYSYELRVDPQAPLCERLGMKYPIFHAGMSFVAHAELADAVSNAGGLGCCRASSMSAHEFKGADLGVP